MDFAPTTEVVLTTLPGHETLGVEVRTMKLQPVTGPTFTAECKGCHKRLCFGGDPSLPFARQHSGGFADLDGKAYEDYYCANCVRVSTGSYSVEVKP